jgi:hypothetical protein
MPMTFTTEGIIAALYIAVAVVLLIILYHVLFIVVDLRKTMRRLSNLTEQLEAVIMKPISLADKGFDWVMSLIEGAADRKENDKD